MTNRILITPATGTWVIRAAGAVLGESRNALELKEGDYPAVIYFRAVTLRRHFLRNQKQLRPARIKGRQRITRSSPKAAQ
jgi:uncharacterized protein (DUF427 family)